MPNKTMPITEAIDKITDLASDSHDIEIISSSNAALRTLRILQILDFKNISVDILDNMRDE